MDEKALSHKQAAEWYLNQLMEEGTLKEAAGLLRVLLEAERKRHGESDQNEDPPEVNEKPRSRANS